MMLANPHVEAQAHIDEQPKESISFEDYLDRFGDLEGMYAEWLVGEVAVYPMSNNLNHVEILRFLSFLLDLFVSSKGLGKVLFTGLPMKWSDQHPARVPDLIVILSAHLDRIRPTFVDGSADIVVEVISPESEERDRAAKFLEYEAAGVPEYWLFDPLRSEADIYALGEDQRYHRTSRDVEGRLISSVLPGFALDTALLWQMPLPTAPEIVALAQEMASQSG